MKSIGQNGRISPRWSCRKTMATTKGGSLPAGHWGQYCTFFESVLAKKVRTDPDALDFSSQLSALPCRRVSRITLARPEAVCNSCNMTRDSTVTVSEAQANL